MKSCVVSICLAIACALAASTRIDPSMPRFTAITKQAGIRLVHLKGNKGFANILEEAPESARPILTAMAGPTSTSSPHAISRQQRPASKKRALP